MTTNPDRPTLEATIHLGWRNDGLLVFYMGGKARNRAVEVDDDTSAIWTMVQLFHGEARPIYGDDKKFRDDLSLYPKIRWTKRDGTLRFYPKHKADAKVEITQDDRTIDLRSLVESVYERSEPLVDIEERRHSKASEMADAFLSAIKEDEPEEEVANYFMGSLNGEDV